MIGLVGNKTERNGASEQREDYKHMKTVERISRFHRKVWKEKRDSYADVGVLDSNQDLKFITTIHC